MVQSQMFDQSHTYSTNWEIEPSAIAETVLLNGEETQIAVGKKMDVPGKKISYFPIYKITEKTDGKCQHVGSHGQVFLAAGGRVGERDTARLLP